MAKKTDIKDRVSGASARLDLLGKEWCSKKNTMTEDEKISLSTSIFLEIDGMLSKDTKLREVLTDFYLQDWPRYSADAGELSHFVRKCLSLRRVDWVHEERGDRRLTVRDPETGKPVYAEGTKSPKRQWVVGSESLDAPVDPNAPEGSTRLDLQSEYADETNPDMALRVDGIMLQLMTCIMLFHRYVGGKANNPKRELYFRMFFTDDAANVIQTQSRVCVFIDHERDLINAMQLGFLDYFMKERCRTVKEIARSPRKCLGELISGEEMIEAKHPLPNIVYLNYFKTETEAGTLSTISEMRSNYTRFLQENGVC